MITCKECGAAIFGRSDKKFCNEQCRSAYHNQLKREDSVCISRINRILMKNRRVLKEFVMYGITELSFQNLAEAGFSKSYITSYRIKDGEPILICYEFSLSIDGNGMAHISVESKQ